jgi:ferritin-like metal-binding protein YciE
VPHKPINPSWAWAEKLGMSDAADLLGQTLQEEKAADEKLTALAESEINVEADEEKPRRTSGRRTPFAS